MVTREIGKQFHALCENRFQIGKDDRISGDQSCLHRLIDTNLFIQKIAQQ